MADQIDTPTSGDDTVPANAFERAMKALMDADPTQALFERTDRGSLRYNEVATQVRAVLRAIREPSAGMIAAASFRPDSYYFHAKEDVDEWNCERFRDMIDAALEER